MDDYEARLTAKLSHEGMTRTLIRAGALLSAYELIRYKGIGPKSRRVGRHLRYRPEDVRAWIEKQE